MSSGPHVAAVLLPGLRAPQWVTLGLLTMLLVDGDRK